MYGQLVFLPGQRSDVEPSSDECSGYASDLGVVEPYVGLVVDAVEQKFESLSVQHLISECYIGAVPPVFPAQIVRNRQIVQTELRVGIDSLLHQRAQYRSGDGCIVPLV